MFNNKRLDWIRVLYSIDAAILFGGSTPFSKLVLANVAPVLFAGTLYLGSASALGLFLLLSRFKADESHKSRLKRKDLRWRVSPHFWGEGGMVGAVLLLLASKQGLHHPQNPRGRPYRVDCMVRV